MKRFLFVLGIFSVFASDYCAAQTPGWSCASETSCQDGLYRRIENRFPAAYQDVISRLFNDKLNHNPTLTYTIVPEGASCGNLGTQVIDESAAFPQVNITIGSNRAIVSLSGNVRLDVRSPIFPTGWDKFFRTGNVYPQALTVSFVPGDVNPATGIPGLGGVEGEAFNGSYLQDSPALPIWYPQGSCRWTSALQTDHVRFRRVIYDALQEAFNAAVQSSLQ